MARKAGYEIVAMNGYPGGLNKDAHVGRLEPTELPEALNVDIGLRGEVVKRKGYERFDTNLTTNIRDMHSWTTTSGVNVLVAVDSTGQVWWAEGSDTAFTNSGKNVGTGGSHIKHPLGFAVANGSLYITSRRGPDNMKWAGPGQSWVDVPGMPKAQFAQWRFDQLFLANIAGKPSQMQVSLEFAPQNFTDEPAIFEFESEDGTEIRGLQPSGDDLLVFKDHAIHIFSGRVRSDFNKYRLDSLRGTVSPRTIAQVRGIIIFLDRDTGVWAWDGQQFTLISEKINRYLLDNMTYTHAFIANGNVRRDQYHLSVPWQGSTTNQHMFIYSTLTNTWTEYDFGVWDSGPHESRDYIAGPRGAVGVYKAREGQFDDGAPIAMRWRTPWLTPAGPGGHARLRRLETNMVASGAEVSVTLFHEYDNNPILSRSFIADNPNKATDIGMIKNLDGWGGLADAHQLEYFSDDDKDVQVNSAHALFTVRIDALGEHV
jgi:hypothetical protein